jgi:hypothetical protein
MSSARSRSAAHCSTKCPPPTSGGGSHAHRRTTGQSKLIGDHPTRGLTKDQRRCRVRDFSCNQEGCCCVIISGSNHTRVCFSPHGQR